MPMIRDSGWDSLLPSQYGNTSNPRDIILPDVEPYLNLVTAIFHQSITDLTLTPKRRENYFRQHTFDSANKITNDLIFEAALWFCAPQILPPKHPENKHPFSFSSLSTIIFNLDPKEVIKALLPKVKGKEARELLQEHWNL